VLLVQNWIGCGDAVFVVAITSGCAFVVPRKLPLEPFHAEVMLLPVSSHAVVPMVLESNIVPLASGSVQVRFPVSVAGWSVPVYPPVWDNWM
jgi:hypothetical protein